MKRSESRFVKKVGVGSVEMKMKKGLDARTYRALLLGKKISPHVDLPTEPKRSLTECAFLPEELKSTESSGSNSVTTQNQLQVIQISSDSGSTTSDDESDSELESDAEWPPRHEEEAQVGTTRAKPQKWLKKGLDNFFDDLQEVLMESLMDDD